MNSLFNTSIEYLKGVGPSKAKILQKEFKIFTFNDLLNYFPYRHIDKSEIHHIGNYPIDGAYVQYKGVVTSFQLLGEKRGKRIVAQFSDGTGSIELVWFNGLKWVLEMLEAKREFIVFGKLTSFNHRFSITHPEMIEPKGAANQPPIPFLPLYNTSDKAKRGGLDSRSMAKLIFTLLGQVAKSITEVLPATIINNYQLSSLAEAYIYIHYPQNKEQLKRATLRLKFDELFFIQLRLIQLKLFNQRNTIGHQFKVVGSTFNTFYDNHLPFALTNAQKRVIKEMRADMGSGRQMNRLLQGDVGSGKTNTALLLTLIAKDNGYQSCLIAPTEILAFQHYQSISKQLKEMEVNVAFLSGSSKVKERRKIDQELSSGIIDIIVGTHALLEERVQYYNLGLVVIDEQHRFGVEQRAKMWKKNSTPPHILVMTATPIPRTLAMTLYGDLDVSVIDELPKGRKPIITKHLYEKNRLALFGFLKKEIDKGRQVFVVYPMIKESEKVDLLNLMTGYECMSDFFLPPHYQIGIVHGKMSAEEKDFEMQRFLKKETQILLATTVIEVGIDVPNATVMVIENAERFGLSQLHQLRGRVGRGGEQSYCLLVTNYNLTSDGKQRLAAMVNTTDGFEIAKYDLELRGAGDLQGTQQSGIMDFKLANLTTDEKLVTLTRDIAVKIMEEDYYLAKEENQAMKNHLYNIISKNEYYGNIS